MISSIYYSFTRYDLLREPVFIGLQNYREIFVSDPRMGTVVLNTLYYVFLSVPLSTITALLVAALLNTRILGRPFFRAIFFFPAIVPITVIAMMWGFLLNPQFGAINGLLKGLGLPIVPFLSNPDLAKPTLIVINCWASGYAMVLYLASLQDVPRELYEAATVDGAGPVAKFFSITLPLISPVILFNLVTGLIGAFQDFSLPWLLTGGGPNGATEFYALHLFRNAFRFLRMGKAAAMAWLMFIVIVGFTIILFKTSARWVYYGAGDDSKGERRA
ncbi:MAG: sugar ABC transporter permease [Anaerolineae bacterium]|nr:sugar ABC transporter permease [Anaerolineae bacterium]